MSGLAATSLGRYYLKERLGRGGMSEVYLAWDEHMQREVALKVVSSTHIDYIERFHREAEAISHLHHAHILPALDYGEQEPWHYLVMPYIGHGTLRDLLINGPLTLEETGALLEQVAEALQFAHNQGIIHRDIKPSNILMRDDHYVYLADFGLAKTLEGGSTVTQTGNLLGTPEYMAPELADGPATTSSDLYALGILLYQMVTGQLPFSGETPVAVYWKQLQDMPTRPSHINPDVPPAIEQVIMKALDKKPQRRYQSAKELAEAYINALTFPNEVVKESVATPSFYSTTSMNGGSVPAGSAAPVLAQREKLVLPNDPLVAPTAAPQRRRRLIRRVVPPAMRRRGSRAASLPPYPAEPVVPAVARQRVYVSQPKVQVPSRRRRILYRRRNRILISFMVVLVMLLLVIVVILTLAYIYK